MSVLLTFFQADVLAGGRPHIIGRWPDNLAILALFDDVGRPTGGAGHDEQRREHEGRNTHHVIGHRAVPVQVGKHVLLIPHDVFDDFGDIAQGFVAKILAQLARQSFQYFGARI